MKLTQDNIKDHFSLPTADRTASLVGKNPYDFVNRNSDVLLITIGDSWTWGADLTKEKFSGTHIDRLADDDYRLSNVYGGVLSLMLNADFLNLGESGSGNYYILEKLQELSKLTLDYKRVIVICTFTEVARDFDSLYDRDIDYFTWLSNNIHSPSDYNNFLKFINTQISTEISKIDINAELYFATNFVDPIGIECLSDKLLNQTWLQTWCNSKGIEYSYPCYLVSPWIFDKLNNIFVISPKTDRTTYISWVADALDAANLRAEICKKDGINFGQLLHPLAEGHKLWAEYIYNELA